VGIHVKPQAAGAKALAKQVGRNHPVRGQVAAHGQDNLRPQEPTAALDGRWKRPNKAETAVLTWCLACRAAVAQPLSQQKRVAGQGVFVSVFESKEDLSRKRGQACHAPQIHFTVVEPCSLPACYGGKHGVLVLQRLHEHPSWEFCAAGSPGRLQ
jgi:hypothetical protein